LRSDDTRANDINDEADVQARPVQRRKSNTSAFVSDFRDLTVGDYVVHVEHGIARYCGLRVIEEPNQPPLELMILEFADEAKLYVPLTRLDLIQKYRSTDTGPAPQLNKLGTQAWQKTKARVKKAMADMSAELPSELPGDVDAAPSSAADPAGTFEMTRKGVIEKGVTAEDFETHYDLGIAYKEMGLLDDAVNEFRIVMKDPGREVQCHLMIGLCFLEKGMQTDAIGQFKKGLYVEGITEREALSMYFELGQAYERLNDPREAMYYYEKVLKRDQHFRDVQSRINALRGGGQVAQAMPEARGDDVDAAFDTLLGKDA